MKPGYKTTEFYFTLAANAVGAAFASGLFSDGSVWARALGMAAMVLTGMGYSVSRGMVKAAGSATPTAVSATSLSSGQAP